MINVWFTLEGSQFFLDKLFIIFFEYYSSAPEVQVVMFIGCFCGNFFLRFCIVNPNAKNTILHIDICSRHSCVILEFYKSRFLFRYLYQYIRTGPWIVHISQTIEFFLFCCMFFKLLCCDSNFQLCFQIILLRSTCFVRLYQKLFLLYFYYEY